MRFTFLAVLLPLFCGHLVAQDATVGTPPESPATTTEVTPKAQTPMTEYVRVFSDDAGNPVSMQTATARYVGVPGSPYAGRTVDLVGVVHIGEAQYYEQLDQQLGTYDKVLYELVAPDGTRIRPEDLKDRRSLLSSLQSGMRDMLNLEYQLEKINYMADNFRHADMSPDEFSKDLEKNGDSVLKMVARMMGAGIASQTKQRAEADMFSAMFSEDRSMMLKRSMAKQLVDSEMIDSGMDDATGNNTLVKGRNRKAFEILKEELDNGAKTIAVFYGAAHLPDMDQRLRDEFKMQPESVIWVDAWDLTKN